MTKIIEQEITIHLTKSGKLPLRIPCHCLEEMHRLMHRPGAAYRCRECGSETTLDPEELKRKGLV